jgi:probable rRNA maturation factor
VRHELFGGWKRWLPVEARRLVARLVRLGAKHSPPEPWLREVFLELVILGLMGMRRLNRKYRAQDRPTDILTFREDLPHLKQSRVSLVLCPTYIGQRWKPELATRGAKQVYRRLIVHGLLHGVGYDHDTERRARSMAKMEERLGLKGWGL